LQISRLSVVSLANLAACLIRRELPEDFPPKDICATLFNSTQSIRPSSSPIVVKVPKASVTCTQYVIAGDKQPLVTVSNFKKRSRAEPQTSIESDDEHSFFCDFTPTEKVSESMSSVVSCTLLLQIFFSVVYGSFICQK
jgi:hypothetical protein